MKLDQIVAEVAKALVAFHAHHLIVHRDSAGGAVPKAQTHFWLAFAIAPTSRLKAVSKLPSQTD